MIVIDVFVKGDALTPHRFWDYALRTETKHARFYHEMGFQYSKRYSEEYENLSETERKKVQFLWINGVKQEK